MYTAPFAFFNLTIKFFFKFPAEFLEKILCVAWQCHLLSTHNFFSKNSAWNLKKNLKVRLKKCDGAIRMTFSRNFISYTKFQLLLINLDTFILHVISVHFGRIFNNFASPNSYRFQRKLNTFLKMFSSPRKSFWIKNRCSWWIFYKWYGFEFGKRFFKQNYFS